MKCECGTMLHPLTLKQVVKGECELLFELECINPYCRKKSYVSEAGYFFVKQDVEILTKPIPYIKNMKLPNEMNVVFVSMGRCGISWVIRLLSQIHNIMFGTPIYFDAEHKNVSISHVIATRKKYALPQGWCNVYDVEPQKLVERGYDRVIIIKREYETMKKAHKIYESIHDRDKTMLEHFDRDYNKVYGTEIDHPRCLKVNLEDLNAYTVAIFKELLDFLNFPETGRPVIVPVKPTERKWEVYSSILKKGKKVNKRLTEIDKLYNMIDEKKEYS